MDTFTITKATIDELFKALGQLTVAAGYKATRMLEAELAAAGKIKQPDDKPPEDKGFC